MVAHVVTHSCSFNYSCDTVQLYTVLEYSCVNVHVYWGASGLPTIGTCHCTCLLEGKWTHRTAVTPARVYIAVY